MNKLHMILRKDRKIIIDYILITVLLLLCFCSCTENWNLFGEWDYQLVNGYQVSRFSGNIIFLLSDHDFIINGENYGNIMIDTYIFSFCNNERYIGIQWIDPETIEDRYADISEIEALKKWYYLVDSETDTKYGPFETIEQFEEACETYFVGTLGEWIATRPDPKGATY